MIRKQLSVLAILTVTAVTISSLAVQRSSSVDAAGEAMGPLRYKVSITNLTRGQIFSPAVVATHTSAMHPLFELGAPASDELAAVAEDAVVDPLIEQLEGSPNVSNVLLLTGENGPILPGETASVIVDVNPTASLVSLVGMLVTTNDAFYGMNAAASPRAGSSVHFLRAYDAGSEANNELCSHVPGPPCGSGGVRDTAGAEGYVHVHAGIHGIADLVPSMHDWHNPVALLKIQRVGMAP